MKKKEKNYTFIDSQNLNLSIQRNGWKLSFLKFRKYLKDKYDIHKAYLFIGYISKYKTLYKHLENFGFKCIFKPTVKYRNQKVKGNCDAELVLQTMIDYRNYNKAVIVTGDGDFHCLIKYLIGTNKLEKLLIPNKKRYSALLKKFPSHHLSFICDLRNKLEYKKEENTVSTET